MLINLHHSKEFAIKKSKLSYAKERWLIEIFFVDSGILVIVIDFVSFNKVLKALAHRMKR